MDYPEVGDTANLTNHPRRCRGLAENVDTPRSRKSRENTEPDERNLSPRDAARVHRAQSHHARQAGFPAKMRSGDSDCRRDARLLDGLHLRERTMVLLLQDRACDVVSPEQFR